MRADLFVQDPLAGLGGRGHALYEATKTLNALTPEEQNERFRRAGVTGSDSKTYKRYKDLYNNNYVPWAASQGVAAFPITADKADDFFAVRAASGTSQATADGLESMLKAMQHDASVRAAR